MNSGGVRNEVMGELKDCDRFKAIAHGRKVKDICMTNVLHNITYWCQELNSNE